MRDRAAPASRATHPNPHRRTTTTRLCLVVACALLPAGCPRSTTPRLTIHVDDVAGSDGSTGSPQSPGAHDSTNPDALDGPTVRIDGSAAHVESATATDNRAVALAGARREALSFTFSLSRAGAWPEDLTLRYTPLTSDVGIIGPTAVTFDRLHTVSVPAWPGWHIRAIPPNRRVDKPADVLVPIDAPIGGLPAPADPAKTIRIWTDLTVPPDAAPGLYDGRVEILSSNERLGFIDLQLVVRPFTLPDDPPPLMLVAVDHQAVFRHHVVRDGRPHAPASNWDDDPLRDRLDAVLADTMRLLRRHGLTPVLPGVFPKTRIDARGEPRIDWSAYDRIVEPYISGAFDPTRPPPAVWPIPFDATHPAPVPTGNVPSVAYARTVRAYLKQCADHFAERGWLDRAYLQLPHARPDRVDDRDTVAMLATLARRADERLTILSDLFPQDAGAAGWVNYPGPFESAGVDIWMPPAQFYDPDAMSKQRQFGRRTWLKLDRPPFSGTTSIAADDPMLRCIPWVGDALGAACVYLGVANRWPDTPAPATPDACIACDPRTLIYPGTPFGLDHPIASVRLKRLRTGIQDLAYVRLLRANRLDHVASALSSALVRDVGTDAYRAHFAGGGPIGWARDPATWRTARTIATDELLGKTAHPGTVALPAQIRWRRFMGQTHGLALSVAGTRLDERSDTPRQVDRDHPASVDDRANRNDQSFPTDPSPNPERRSIAQPNTVAKQTPAGRTPIRIETTVHLTNQRRHPLSGTVLWGTLPSGWTPVGQATPIDGLPVGHRIERLLRADTPALPAWLDGVARVPLIVRLHDPDSTDPASLETRAATARVCHVAAVRAENPPRIDGGLSDWPAGIGNVASDFRLICGPNENAPDADIPARATNVYVAADERYLYVAIHCQADPTPPQIRRRKGVRYDDLIPTGEDMVELLFDPTGAGGRSPTNLFHIVIKRSGSDVESRGVRLGVPCGRSQPWAVDLELATAEAPGRWLAELRIPLSAFGPDAAGQRIWGFNITRLDAARAQFSTWSGAVGNAYDPQTLGNLSLP